MTDREQDTQKAIRTVTREFTRRASQTRELTPEDDQTVRAVLAQMVRDGIIDIRQDYFDADGDGMSVTG